PRPNWSALGTLGDGGSEATLRPAMGLGLASTAVVGGAVVSAASLGVPPPGVTTEETSAAPLVPQAHAAPLTSVDPVVARPSVALARSELLSSTCLDPVAEVTPTGLQSLESDAAPEELALLANADPLEEVAEVAPVEPSAPSAPSIEYRQISARY